MIFDGHGMAAYKIAQCYMYGMNTVAINREAAIAPLRMARQWQPRIMGVSSLWRLLTNPIEGSIMSDCMCLFSVRTFVCND
jgi:hypothetical protein